MEEFHSEEFQPSIVSMVMAHDSTRKNHIDDPERKVFQANPSDTTIYKDASKTQYSEYQIHTMKEILQYKRIYAFILHHPTRGMLRLFGFLAGAVLMKLACSLARCSFLISIHNFVCKVI